MDCLLIFDHLNDLIFKQCNEKFNEYITNFAVNQELISEGNIENVLSNNVLIQIFSPIITSHRIMHCQFGNTYSCIDFHDKLQIHFSEFMGYLFVAINDGKIKHFVQKCVILVTYLCGPNVYQLQSDESKSVLLSQLINKWLQLQNENQAIYVEAIEQLVVNNDLSSTCIEILKESITQLSIHTECSKVHALLLVDDKFLSLYSSANAKQLSASDILFTIILTHCHHDGDNSLQSYQVLLVGSEDDPKCLPHIIHIFQLSEKVFLIYLVEIGNPAASAALYENFCHLHKMQYIQIQRNKYTIQLAFENLELAVKKLHDNMKKTKNSFIEGSHKQLMKKWEVIKCKYKEYLKTESNEAILRAETLSLGFLDNLKELFNLMTIDNSLLNHSALHVQKVVPQIKANLEPFTQFFNVKGVNNFSLGSDFLTVNKYMENFPGLVHFLYIDRNTHRVTTPTLDMTAEKADFMKKKIWIMISFAHSHLQEGHTTIIWKDTTFTYGYFLWFEDHSGEALNVTVNPNPNLNPTSYIPGILGNDFFLNLKKSCLPKLSPSKIRCYELFCMHLGLTTSSAMLEQARRLAASVWELRGFPAQAIDLL